MFQCGTKYIFESLNFEIFEIIIDHNPLAVLFQTPDVIWDNWEIKLHQWWSKELHKLPENMGEGGVGTQRGW